MPSPGGRSPKQDAAAIRRLFSRKQMLENQLREVDDRMLRIGGRLCRANGIITPLKGKQLLDLAERA